jgi:hypothetical protein
MGYQLWSQDNFSKGELSPFMYGRVTVNEYGNGLKTAVNTLTYPTGAVGKRFGTLYMATLSGFTAFNQIYFQTFQYLNQCIYQLLFAPSIIYIYLEGIQVATVSTSLTAFNVWEMSTTVLGSFFRTAGQGFVPMDLSRSPSSSGTINAFTSTTLSTSAATFHAAILPVIFAVTGGTLIQTTPQITAGVVYFAVALSTTQIVLFETPELARAFIVNPTDTSNAITIQSLGTGTTTVTPQNTWTFSASTFKNLPVYDFNGSTTSYDAITFTPSATIGSAVTIHLSAPYAPLDSSYVGGAFIGGGGTGRITAVADTSNFTVSVQEPFDSIDAIQGSLAFLAEPAWSDKRGWPQVCSSYQNRALFANTVSLPNGFYASVVNDYTDFGDLTNDDDDAISWYPSSDNVNYIRFIVPYRSITVHTNTGIYSSPLSDIAAITPTNFTLQLQDSTPADVLQPQAIDNQVLVLSGNDAHQMLWDGINNAYTSDIVSVINEQTIRDPMDETAFADLKRAGSRYVFIINANGSMAIFQTLLSQNVAGFVPAIMEQSYSSNGSPKFLQSASSSNGRAWFVVQRQVATAGSPVLISGFTAASGSTPSTLKATAVNLSTTTPTAILFTTTGSLPASIPPITTTNYFWAIGTDADHFIVYTTQEDAIVGVNSINFTSSGTLSNVVPWPLSTIFTMEELTKEVFLDCAVQYAGTPSGTLTTAPLFNAQDVKMVGDGFGFDSPAENNLNNEITFEAHGQVVLVSNAFIGFPINTKMEPLPLSISNGPSAKTTTLTRPKHIRNVNFMFNNTIGGTINGVPIALNTFDQANIGEPPFPSRGIFELAIMQGWDDFNNSTYLIEHNDPFDIQLLGAFYAVDI